MIASITLVFVGFSILSAPILLIAYQFFLRDMRKSQLGRIASVFLLGSMTGLQIYHWLFLQSGVEPFDHRSYMLLQLLTPAAFFFFSREVLVPGSTTSPWQGLHLLPLLVSPLLPLDMIPVVAFVLGSGYSAWFAMFVFGLRRHVRRYLFELFFFCYFAVLAIIMLVLATSARSLGTDIFYVSYALFTGASFFLLTATMIWFPYILVDISDAASRAYARSTLSGIDVEARLAALAKCMDNDKLYQDEHLSLGMAADTLSLTPHQLSELINTHFGHGFSRYIREQRVAEARRLLLSDRNASVLSIGMETGFRSQSNFYAAFREITGESPGAFRDRPPKD